jgi:beta-glucanase (GH16 family)
VDPSRWHYEVGHVRNDEAQYYTEARVENARQEDGHLLIEGRRESYMGSQYTSASIHTLGLFGFTNGRLEVRAQIPTGRGSWPAIWLLGVNIETAGWPACGEVDVMENVGFAPNTV